MLLIFQIGCSVFKLVSILRSNCSIFKSFAAYFKIVTVAHFKNLKSFTSLAKPFPPTRNIFLFSLPSPLWYLTLLYSKLNVRRFFVVLQQKFLIFHSVFMTFATLMTTSWNGFSLIFQHKIQLAAIKSFHCEISTSSLSNFPNAK